MPRGLQALKEDTLQGMPELTKSPDEDEHLESSAMNMEDEDDIINALSQRNSKRDELHLFVQSLTLSDIESCIRLEDATFPPNERCTREKVSRPIKRMQS